MLKSVSLVEVMGWVILRDRNNRGTLHSNGDIFADWEFHNENRGREGECEVPEEEDRVRP